MKEDNNIFDFRMVPPSFALCFKADCPRAAECLRFKTAGFLPAKHQMGPAIYPNITVGEKGCRYFHPSKPKVMAWGLSSMFYDVRSFHVADLRAAVKNYLGGHTNYYRYNRGEYLLSPEQQKQILKIFKKNGYEDVDFEHYVTTYDFKH